jgi:hypothetical protein
MYPGFPFSGYHDTYTYNRNLIDLDNYIKELTININQKSIIHISIGAAAEEARIDFNKDIKYQWEQLFPEHLYKIIKTNPSIPVYHIIIAPNNFLKDHYMPIFIKKTKLNWIYRGHNTFQLDNLTIKMFCCPMPSNCDYTKLIDNLRTHNIKDENYYKSIDQTNQDRIFINNFYKNLECLFNKVNYYDGIISCYSFAVFNADTMKARYNNFSMFKEIKDLFPKNKLCQRILAEWVYILSYYNVHVFNTNQKICFSKLMKNKKIHKLRIRENNFVIKKSSVLKNKV